MQVQAQVPPPMPEAAKYMTPVIWIAAIALLWYAWRQRANGVLR